MFEKAKNLKNAIDKRTKNDMINNRVDGDAKKIYHEKLDLYIKILNDQIETYDKYIKITEKE